VLDFQLLQNNVHFQVIKMPMPLALGGVRRVRGGRGSWQVKWIAWGRNEIESNRITCNASSRI